MTAEIQALRHGRLVLIEISERITRADLDESYAYVFAACGKSALPVCCIYNVAPHVTVAPNLISVAVGHPYFVFKHPNFGLCICVVTSNYIRKLVEIVGQLEQRSSGKLHVVKSMDAAMRTVENYLEAHSSCEDMTAI